MRMLSTLKCPEVGNTETESQKCTPQLKFRKLHIKTSFMISLCLSLEETHEKIKQQVFCDQVY